MANCDSRSVTDDSRVMLQLVASFTIAIFLWYRPQKGRLICWSIYDEE